MSRLLDRLVVPVACTAALAAACWLLAVGAPRAAQQRSRVAVGDLAESSTARLRVKDAVTPVLTFAGRIRLERRPASYPVNWRRRYLAEHRHVQRLLHTVTRTVQAHETGVAYWRARQIAAAETIGREAAADPWPNCSDPIFNGAPSWDVTVACENSGSWLDSPGYYRCGLQFDPMWEQRFGALCP